MRKFLGMAVLIVGASAVAMAGVLPNAGGVPEIDATTAASALGLLAGAVIVIRGRKK